VKENFVKVIDVQFLHHLRRKF